MARRGVNEGSVYQRKGDGRWVGVLHLGYGGGSRQRKSFYGATRPEVASKLAAAVRDLQLGVKPVAEVEKLGDFIRQWLEGVAKRSVRASTYAVYERTVRLYIEPEIGHLKLARLTAGDLDALYTRLLDRLGGGTVHLAHAVIHRALTYARRRGAVAVNVADDVDPPRITAREARTLSPQEAVHLLDAIRSDRLHALFGLALTTGLRQAELLGLRWADLDLDGAVLAVRQQVYQVAGEWVYSEPKTAKGRRTVSLSGSAVAALRERRLGQNEERLRAPTWAANDLVFSDTLGRPMDASTLRRAFRALLERAGLPRMRFHDLRHTAATLLLAEGIHPKVVQERLGHSSISMTLDTYSHVMPSMQRDAADRLDRLLAANE